MGSQRKDVLDMLETESRLLQRDERQTEEARAALERLRRETGDSKGVASEEVDVLRPRRPLSNAAADADNWLRSPQRTPLGSQPSSPGIHLRTPASSHRGTGASAPKPEIWQNNAAANKAKHFAA